MVTYLDDLFSSDPEVLPRLLAILQERGVPPGSIPLVNLPQLEGGYTYCFYRVEGFDGNVRQEERASGTDALILCQLLRDYYQLPVVPHPDTLVKYHPRDSLQAAKELALHWQRVCFMKATRPQERSVVLTSGKVGAEEMEDEQPPAPPVPEPHPFERLGADELPFYGVPGERALFKLGEQIWLAERGGDERDGWYLQLEEVASADVQFPALALASVRVESREEGDIEEEGGRFEGYELVGPSPQRHVWLRLGTRWTGQWESEMVFEYTPEGLPT